MPDFFGDGNTPRRSDPQWVILQKILGAVGGGGGGGGTGDQQVYMDRDPAAPDNPALPAINYRTDLGSWTQWNGSAWV